VPDFGSFDNLYSLTDIRSDPLLYEGCYVLWSGRVTNIGQSDTEIGFDFLVGYEKKEVLEGIIPVILDFAVSIEPDFAYEVLGQIVYDRSQIILKAVSIHSLGPDP
jgi:hypothetical protein